MTGGMDDKIVAELKDAGVDVSNKRVFPLIHVNTDGGRGLKPIDWEVDILLGATRVGLRMKPIGELFSGQRQPPSFAHQPPEEYLRPIILLGRTAMNCCAALGRPERDVEFERLFSQLRRRPDGKDGNPIFSYLRAAAQFYLSVEIVSQAEFQAVAGWLARMARQRSGGPSTANFIPWLQQSINIPPLPGQ